MSIHYKIHETLKQATPALRQLKDDYYVIGAAAMILSGVKVEDTEDVDLLTSNRDADFLKTTWAEKMKSYQPSGSNLFRSNFSRFEFEHLDMEVMGGLEVHKINKWEALQIDESESIQVGDFSIKIPTLAEQKRILLRFGREKDLQRIKLIEERI